MFCFTVLFFVIIPLHLTFKFHFLQILTEQWNLWLWISVRKKELYVLSRGNRNFMKICYNGNITWNQLFKRIYMQHMAKISDSGGSCAIINHHHFIVGATNLPDLESKHLNYLRVTWVQSRCQILSYRLHHAFVMNYTTPNGYHNHKNWLERWDAGWLHLHLLPNKSLQIWNSEL